MRYPDVHGQQVVFTYASDLWIADTNGGFARGPKSLSVIELWRKLSAGVQ